MSHYLVIQGVGVIIAALSIGLMATRTDNRPFFASLMLIGSLIISLSLFMNYQDQSSVINVQDGPNQKLQEEMSVEVGMQALKLTDEQAQNINNKVNTNVYFQDGDCIYLCNVVFENNERNYYFSSGGNSIQLHKNVYKQV